MASSDYAHLMIGSNGKATEKSFVSYCHTEIDLHKARIYLNNPLIAQSFEKLGISQFSFPTIAQLCGKMDMTLGSMQIQIEPLTTQNGIMFFVTSDKSQTFTDIQGQTQYKFSRKCSAGIATSGYENKTNLVYQEFHDCYPEHNLIKYVNDPQYADEFCLLRCSEGKESYYQLFLPETIYPDYKGDALAIEMEERFNEEWIGVGHESISELKEFLRIKTRHDDQKWFKKIDWNALTYVNPGDSYILSALGQPTQTNMVGQPSTPIIQQLIK